MFQAFDYSDLADFARCMESRYMLTVTETVLTIEEFEGDDFNGSISQFVSIVSSPSLISTTRPPFGSFQGVKCRDHQNTHKRRANCDFRHRKAPMTRCPNPEVRGTTHGYYYRTRMRA